MKESEGLITCSTSSLSEGPQNYWYQQHDVPEIAYAIPRDFRAEERPQDDPFPPCTSEE